MTEKTTSRPALEFLKRHWARLLASAGFLAIFLGNQGFRSLLRNYLELRRLRIEILSLEEEEKRAQARLAEVRSGPQTMERFARRELGYIGKGEIEYRFPPPTAEDR